MDPVRGLIHLGLKTTEATLDRVLDVVFATPDVTVLPHREVPWVWEDLKAATDHRPVWVDIETTPLPEGAGTRTGE